MDIHTMSTAALREALRSGADPEALTPDGEVPLVTAAGAGATEKMRLLIDAGADPDRCTADWTALHEAAEEGQAAAVSLLLEEGVSAGLLGRTMERAIRAGGPIPQPAWSPAIGDATDAAVIRLLAGAGESLADIDPETLWEALGRRTQVPLGDEPASFQTDASPRPGTMNPERADVPFWQEMIETGWHAYAARRAYGQPRDKGVVWCHSRFGQALVPLPDGRLVGIGGEHEDYYDPDFHIYSDVIVYPPVGPPEIFLYPHAVFPPTDFHTATLTGRHIYIVGNFGYPAARRAGHTPVYQLDTESFAIEAVETTGTPPGWIGKHRAAYIPEEDALYIWGGRVIEGAPAKGGFRLRLDRHRWEPVPWLPGATK